MFLLKQGNVLPNDGHYGDAILVSPDGDPDPSMLRSLDPPDLSPGSSFKSPLSLGALSLDRVLRTLL